MRNFLILSRLANVSLLVGMLLWSGDVFAVKPNPSGKQGGQFVVLGTGDVLDVTTGLRWQQNPAEPPAMATTCGGPGDLACTWQEAVDYCAELGNGYRLPEVKELSGLVDYSVHGPAPSLPLGHPFEPTRPPSWLALGFWTATSNASNPFMAWIVDFDGGFVTYGLKEPNTWTPWCVR